MRLRTVSQSPAARLMTRSELSLLRRAERLLLRARNAQRGVS
jgi:hypothetical protein